MRLLTEKEIQNLKGAFSNLWPDAAHALKNRYSGSHNHAACQWKGFKTGYIMAKEETQT